MPVSVFQLAGRLNPVIVNGQQHVTFFEAGASRRVRGFFHGHVPLVVDFDGRELQAEFGEAERFAVFQRRDDLVDDGSWDGKGKTAAPPFL